MPGLCQPYRGVACSQFLQNRSIYVRHHSWQMEMEQKLGQAFSVIASSPDISMQCNRYAVSSLCYYVFPLCEEPISSGMPPTPRKVSLFR